MKNLKMFAIAIMAFAMMAMGVHAADAVLEFNDKNYTDVAVAFTDAAKEEKATLKLLGDVTIGSNKTIANDLTIDLNGHKLILGTSTAYNFTVNDEASLTITGKGTVVPAKSAASFVVSGTLNVGEDVTVNGKDVTAPVGVSVAANTAVVSLNGTWKNMQNIVSVAAAAVKGDEGEAAKVTIEGGNYAATQEGIVLAANSYAVITIKGGELSSDYRAISLAAAPADLTISGGVVKSTKGAAIVADGVEDLKLTVTGGTIKSEGTSDSSYALYLTGSNGTYAISGGTFESGKTTKDGKSVQLPAIRIGGEIKEGRIGMITGGRYLSAIVGDVEISSGVSHSAAAAQKLLVKEGLTVTEDNGYKVVGTGTPADEPGTTEPGDTTIPPVPQTNDNILVYAGLGLVSLASVAFTAKKRED